MRLGIILKRITLFLVKIYQENMVNLLFVIDQIHNLINFI